MPFLWQIYTENIDPFMKILHVPTVNKIIRGLKGSYQSLSSSMQALVLAISFAAIMSLEAEEASHSDSSLENTVADLFER